MTKEELEKEAEVFATYYESLFPNDFGTFYKAFLKVAEPREKQIADLEWQLQEVAKDNDNYQKENAELKEKVDKATELIGDMYDKIPASHSDYYKDVLERAEQFIKEFEIREDRLCEYCDQYKFCPDGKRCRTCDNGSKWKRQSNS